MLDLAVVFATGLALVSFLTSCISLMIHYGKRAEHPLTAPLQQQIEALQLGQADIIDRVDHWTRRDRTRRLRAEKVDDDTPPEPIAAAPHDIKAQLRAKVRAMGVPRQ